MSRPNRQKFVCMNNEGRFIVYSYSRRGSGFILSRLFYVVWRRCIPRIILNALRRRRLSRRLDLCSFIELLSDVSRHERGEDESVLFIRSFSFARDKVFKALIMSGRERLPV